MAHSEGFLKLAADAKKRIREISVDQLSELDQSQKPVIIDVREESEWNAGHVEGAIHLSRGVIRRSAVRSTTSK